MKKSKKIPCKTGDIALKEQEVCINGEWKPLNVIATENDNIFDIVGNPSARGPINISLSDRVIELLKELRTLKTDSLKLAYQHDLKIWLTMEKDNTEKQIKELDEIIGER